MTTPDSCNVLRKADNGQLVVAADFAATGRPTATFHELVELLQAEYTIWETAPVPYGEERGMTGADQAARWERDIRASGLRVHAVLGFCAGNVYAGELAGRIAAWQEPPRLILLDPGRATRRMVVEHIESVIGRLASTFTPDALAEARQAVRDADESLPDVLALVDRLAGLCRDVVLPALMRAFHSRQASTEFTTIITGYLYWLAGATQLDPRPVWAGATALNSTSTNYGLYLTPPEEREALVASATYYDVTHGNMMRTPEIAAAVDKLLS
jgi:hypothetical protein